MRHIPRFYCPDQALQKGATILLPEMAAHHAKVVLRLKDDAPVKLFNGTDGEWQGVCAFPDKKHVTVMVQDQLHHPETLPNITLVLAPLKNKDSFDQAIRHAVELGVTSIQLVQTAFTQQTKLNLDKIQYHIVDAVQQCGRMTVPALKPMVGLTNLLAQWPTDVTLLACVEGQNTIPTLLDHSRTCQAPVALLVGPEGGFSDSEKEILTAQQQSWLQPVSLGTLILRADTAVAAGLAQLQAIAAQ